MTPRASMPGTKQASSSNTPGKLEVPKTLRVWVDLQEDERWYGDSRYKQEPLPITALYFVVFGDGMNACHSIMVEL